MELMDELQIAGAEEEVGDVVVVVLVVVAADIEIGRLEVVVNKSQSLDRDSLVDSRRQTCFRRDLFEGQDCANKNKAIK